jgi:CBS-domain-containing membrane protein
MSLDLRRSQNRQEEIVRARDVMVFPVTTVSPDTWVRDLAKTLVEKSISGAPVVDESGKLVGMVSEGDLLHRSEAGTERRLSGWLRMLAGDDQLAADYIKARGRRVADIMTEEVVTATPDTPLHEVATLMEKHAIKRIPIVQDDRLVGIVTRANLVQAVASVPDALEISPTDSDIRERLLSHLGEQPWAHRASLNVTVKNGVVSLWGLADSETEKQAIRVAAETLPGVRGVNDHLIVRPYPYLT